MVYDYLKTTFILCKKGEHRHKNNDHLDRLHVEVPCKILLSSVWINIVQKDFTKVKQEELDKFRFAVNKDFYSI